MNIELLDAAKEKLPNVPILINLISKRVRQLNAGQRPYVKPDAPNQSNLDIALKEVSEGAITWEAWEPGGETAEDAFTL